MERTLPEATACLQTGCSFRDSGHAAFCLWVARPFELVKTGYRQTFTSMKESFRGAWKCASSLRPIQQKGSHSDWMGLRNLSSFNKVFSYATNRNQQQTVRGKGQTLAYSEQKEQADRAQRSQLLTPHQSDEAVGTSRSPGPPLRSTPRGHTLGRLQRALLGASPHLVSSQLMAR